MSVNPELLEILVCPESKQPVKPAGAELIASLAAQVEAGTLRNRGGEKVTQPIAEGLVREPARGNYTMLFESYAQSLGSPSPMGVRPIVASEAQFLERFNARHRDVLSRLREVRNTWQFFRDRRPETYDSLTDLN